MMENEHIVKLKDFFDFDKKEPINRIAYTEEDLEYKIKIIDKMKELGMHISMDNARKYLWYNCYW